MSKSDTHSEDMTEIDNLIFQVMCAEKNAIDPSNELRVEVVDFEPLEPGDILMLPSGHGTTERWCQIGRRVLSVLRETFGLSADLRASAGRDSVLLKIRRVVDNEIRFNGVSPWFMEWYTKSSLIHLDIRNLISVLQSTATRNDGRMIYRGEDDLYQSVRSTLSRRWDTTNPRVLAELKSESVAAVRSVTGDASDSAVHATRQHLGGPSNLIDFTQSVWVALYFATCQSDDKTGRIWALTAGPHEQQIEISMPKTMTEELAARRTQMQMSYLVETPSGEIDHGELIEIATIPGQNKDAARQMLSRIGITRQSLFPDMIAVLEDDQESISWDGFLTLMTEWLRREEYERVISATQSLIDKRGDSLDDARRGVVYFRGLAKALAGDPKGGYADLREVKGLMTQSGGDLAILNRNLAALVPCTKSLDVSRLMSRLDLTVWDDLYVCRLEGFRFRGLVDSADESEVSG